MRYPEFIERVMANVDFESRDQAELVIKESLAALGERIYRTEQDKLAAQLAKELREYLSSRAEPETMRGDTPRYSLEEYYNRVSARTDVGFPEVIEQSRAVMRVLQEAVSSPVLEEILQDLPEEYRELFSEEPHSPASPTSLAE